MAKRPAPPAGATNSVWTGSELVSFDWHTLTIQRVSLGRKGTNTYPIARISGVRVEKPGFMKVYGRFRILVAGEDAPRRRQSARNAARDPLVVLFSGKQLAEFEALAAEIRFALDQRV